MAYEPLNLQNGQTLTAEDLQHMEHGIAGVLPQNPGAYQYPATDGDGNLVWADRLAYSDEQRVYWNGIDNFQFAGTEPDSSNYESWTTPFDTNASYSVLFDGVLYKDVTLISGEYTADLGSVGFSDYPFVVGYDLEMGRVGYIQTSVDGNHTISIYTASESVKTIDPKFLPDLRGTAFYVNVTQTDTDTYTADKTYTEISNAITNGLIPYCVYGNYLLPMVNSTSGMLSGIAPAIAASKKHNFFAVVPNTSNSNQFDFINVFIDQYNDVFVRSKEFSFTS